jgi:SanA protein
MKAVVAKIKAHQKSLLKWFIMTTSLSIFVILSCNIWIVQSTKDKNYIYVSEIPSNDVGLLLGTSKYNRSGKNNPFFYNRIEAASSLYHAGKIKHIIVSGDNALLSYNEPRDMRRALIKEGVPESAITLDFAGFRTFDSVIRSKKVFGQQSITIISQRFHNQRALFIAEYYNINAIGFCAEDAPGSMSYPTYLREFFARFKAVIDLYILNQKPKFLGKKEKIILT